RSETKSQPAACLAVRRFASSDTCHAWIATEVSLVAHCRANARTDVGDAWQRANASQRHVRSLDSNAVQRTTVVATLLAAADAVPARPAPAVVVCRRACLSARAAAA